jgi:hypothetical protein
MRPKIKSRKSLAEKSVAPNQTEMFSKKVLPPLNSPLKRRTLINLMYDSMHNKEKWKLQELVVNG